MQKDIFCREGFLPENHFVAPRIPAPLLRQPGPLPPAARGTLHNLQENDFAERYFLQGKIFAGKSFCRLARNAVALGIRPPGWPLLRPTVGPQPPAALASTLKPFVSPCVPAADGSELPTVSKRAKKINSEKMKKEKKMKGEKKDPTKPTSGKKSA